MAALGTLRPKHIAWLLVLLIVLETILLRFKSLQNVKSKVAPSHSIKKPIHHFTNAGSRGADAPRIAIVTLQAHQPGPSNMNSYAKRWGYDVVDASASVQGAAVSIRRYGGDPTFLRMFAILRFLPQYDWVFWHDPDSFFLNFSRPIDEFVDPKFDFIFTTSPCGSGVPVDQQLNIGIFLVQNNKMAISTLKSVWGLWNHTHCKYGEKQVIASGVSLCEVKAGRASYWEGDKGALMSVLANCDVCAERLKYTGYRAFNSMYPCHGQGDLVVHLPGFNATTRRAILQEFLEHSDLEAGTFDDERPLLRRNCGALSQAHSCSTRTECDRLYHGLNSQGRCAEKGKDK